MWLNKWLNTYTFDIRKGQEHKSSGVFADLYTTYPRFMHHYWPLCKPGHDVSAVSVSAEEIQERSKK